MSEGKQRKIGALLSYVVIVLNIVIAIGYTPFLTGHLGQSEYGLYSMVSSIISYLTIFDLGFSSAIIIYSSKYRAKNEKEKEYQLYGMFMVVYIIIGILVSLMGLILVFNTENLFSGTMNAAELSKAKDLMQILVLNLAVTFPLSIFSSIVNSYERYIFAKIINIITILLKPMIMLPLLFMGFKSVALVVVITLVNIFSLLMNVFYCFKKLKIKLSFKKLNFKLLIEIISFSFWIFLNTIIDKINWSLDNILLGAFAGTIEVSIYAIASQINQLYISFSTAISGVLLPKVTKMVEKGVSDKEITNEILIKSGRIQLMIVGIILSGFIIFGKDFILFWVGEKYIKAYYIAIALMVPMLVSLIQNSCVSVVQAKNKHKFMPITLLITSILNVFISIPLIKLYGGIGAALGTAVSLLIGNIIIKNIYYYKCVNIDVLAFFKNITPILLFQIIYCTLSYIIVAMIGINSIIIMIILIIIYSIIYFGFIYLFTNEYERSIINKIYFKLKRGGILK